MKSNLMLRSTFPITLVLSSSTLTNVLLGFLLIGPLAGMGLGSIVYDGDLMSDINDHQSSSALAFALMLKQGATTLVGLILIPIIQILVIERKPLSGLFPQASWHPTLLLLVSIATILLIVAVSPIIIWNAAWELPVVLSDFERWALTAQARSVHVVSILTSQTSIPYIFGAAIVTVFLPAIGEELVFRGIIQNQLMGKSNNHHLAIWGAAMIFSLAHFHIYGLVPRVLFGALFGYAYHWSGNLLYPIIMHFVNNAFVLMLSYHTMPYSDQFGVDQSNSLPTIWVILAATTFAATVFLIYRIRLKIIGN
ncbi:CPBP family intramembrane glutamic endopeptidase [Chryseolinea sp. T2]|uniref:CPBP family intramembrane glutamic endopeptidase n=1 Tax=Chryseolinea sp. T2 TaxID=3129255 RepID=UPI00307873C6